MIIIFSEFFIPVILPFHKKVKSTFHPTNSVTYSKSIEKPNTVYGKFFQSIQNKVKVKSTPPDKEVKWKNRSEALFLYCISYVIII